MPLASSPPRFVLLLLLAVMAAVGWAGAASAEPSPRAHLIASRFVAKHCPSFDPAAMNELAAVFQRTIDKRVRNGRVQFQPIQRFAARSEIATLAEYCKRPDVRTVRFLAPASGVKTPDMQVEFNNGAAPLCVEIVSVTGRYPRQWQYRASGGRHVGARPATMEHVTRAIDRKINSGQLTSPKCRDGGNIALHVAERRGGKGWRPIAAAVKDRAAALGEAKHLKGLEIRSRGVRVNVERNAAGRLAVVARPDLRPRYQTALGQMRRGLPVIDQGGARGTPFGGSAFSPRSGGFVRAIMRGLGGIDFSSLELRYVSDRKGQGVRYAFRGRPGAAPDPALGLDAAQDASDAFFVWLALSPDKFWVNLNPTEPNRIIDPALAASDAGRVLLEADLALKKVVAPLVRPDQGPGVQFWRELEALYGERPDLACFTVRQWIVPEPATVHTTGDELYILEAPLTVKMESEFVGGFPGGGCPQGNEAFETAKEEIYRRLILPTVVQAVNTAPEFADLRRVYLSRIAAEWFRARHGRDNSAIGRIADSGDVRRWPATTPWDPVEVFNRYVSSVRNGEWAVNRPVRVNGQDYVISTVFGGVDFSRTPQAKVTKQDFRARWPRVAGRVDRSLRRPAVDSSRGEIWLGGATG